MKIEVGKRYKCGNEVVEIVGMSTIVYIAQVVLKGGLGEFCAFYCDGEYTSANERYLKHYLEEIEKIARKDDFSDATLGLEWIESYLRLTGWKGLKIEIIDEEAEEPKSGTLIKIEPGKIHPFLLVLLKSNSGTLYMEGFFLTASTFLGCDFLCYSKYKSMDGEELTITQDSKAMTWHYDYDGSAEAIFSDPAEAYEYYKKEIEND